MTERVDPADIERIVGTPRHDSLHYGRAVSDEQTFYILHARDCVADFEDLRDCPFSLALDHGLDLDLWSDMLDKPVSLRVKWGQLLPGVVPSVQF